MFLIEHEFASSYYHNSYILVVTLIATIFLHPFDWLRPRPSPEAEKPWDRAQTPGIPCWKLTDPLEKNNMEPENDGFQRD